MAAPRRASVGGWAGEKIIASQVRAQIAQGQPDRCAVEFVLSAQVKNRSVHALVRDRGGYHAGRSAHAQSVRYVALPL